MYYSPHAHIYVIEWSVLTMHANVVRTSFHPLSIFFKNVLCLLRCMTKFLLLIAASVYICQTWHVDEVITKRLIAIDSTFLCLLSSLVNTTATKYAIVDEFTLFFPQKYSIMQAKLLRATVLLDVTAAVEAVLSFLCLEYYYIHEDAAFPSIYSIYLMIIL
ncbi:hypothetical protein ACJX0J_021662, partial [Zea mays]